MKVWNKYDKATPKEAVYVGRPTKFGNPFIVGVHGTRAQVVKKYKAFIKDRPLLMQAARRELKGKDLVCFCAPKTCHADVLLEVANARSDNT